MTPRNLITATIATLAILTATPASNGATTECPHGTTLTNNACQPSPPPTTCPAGTTRINNTCQPWRPPTTHPAGRHHHRHHCHNHRNHHHANGAHR